MARCIRGQLGVLSTTIAIRRDCKFCWYLRLPSVVTKISKLSLSAASSNSPFFSVDQPRSKAVVTSCCVKNCRNGAGEPWSNSTRTYAVAKALRAACSSTKRTCASVTPGNHSTNCDTSAPSSRFSKRADTGTRVPRKTQAPLTRWGSLSTAGQEDQSIMDNMVSLARGDG